jgi:hypothetical protein
MTAEGFQEILSQKQDAELLGVCLRDDVTPYVFEPRPEGWNQFRDRFAHGFGGVKEDITVVGSGRLGFSMKPYNRLKPFTETSDIDVLVVNPELFDRLWYALLAAAYPRNENVQRLGSFLAGRRAELYTGFLAPHEIKLDRRFFGSIADPIVEFKALWFDLLKIGSSLAGARHESVKGRLYRTWKHAEFYHLDSLASLRKSLIEQ